MTKSLSELLADKWGQAELPPEEPKVKKSDNMKKNSPAGKNSPVKKNTTSKKRGRKSTVIDPESKDSENDITLPENSELYEQATKAKLEQEISKAETMKYKAEQERLKLMRSAGELMEYSMGDFLFFGFMDKASADILRLLIKIEPTIKNLTQEMDHKAIIALIKREIESIFHDIAEAQKQEVETWRKEL